MSEKKRAKKLPARWVSFPAALLALMLTGTLLLTLAGATGLYAMSDTTLHTRAALSSDAVDLQMEKVTQNVRAIAENYGFDAEKTLALIDRQSVENLDREMVVWWTEAMRKGELGETPTYEIEGLKDALRADQDFMKTVDPMMEVSTLDAISGKISDAVVNTALLFRETLVRIAVSFAGDRMDIPQIMTLLRKIPWIAGAASLLLMGLIALLMSRNLLAAGKYIGAAISACGLLWLMVMALTWALNLQGMIAEASQALEIQFSHLSRTVTLEGLCMSAALLALGGALMSFASREYRRNG